jgi:hypothetical protein
MQDVTGIWAPTIAGFLIGDSIVACLDFPSLMPLHRAYKGTDYAEMGRTIRRGNIEIKTEALPKAAWRAAYVDHPGGDFLKFNTEKVWPGKLASAPADDKQRLNTAANVVHEVTHMIQDWKRMRLSIVEREMDTHFAQALYLVRVGAEDVWDKSYALHALIAAQNFANDDGYLRSADFRRIRGTVASEIREHYRGKVDTPLDDPYRSDGMRE